MPAAWVLETDGANLKAVMCIDGVDFAWTYSNNCVDTFNVLGIEADTCDNVCRCPTIKSCNINESSALVI